MSACTMRLVQAVGFRGSRNSRYSTPSEVATIIDESCGYCRRIGTNRVFIASWSVGSRMPPRTQSVPIITLDCTVPKKRSSSVSVRVAVRSISDFDRSSTAADPATQVASRIVPLVSRMSTAKFRSMLWRIVTGRRGTTALLGRQDRRAR
ncbi:MAG: hypothetical protein EBS83_08985 [Planctomycetia bacterium]|nr:hypothetical protein [Planctomycetia bacterium]